MLAGKSAVVDEQEIAVVATAASTPSQAQPPSTQAGASAAVPGSTSATGPAPATPAKAAPAPPHVCETAMFMLRLVGCYLQSMDSLRPISGVIFKHLTDVFDEFYRVVWANFAKGFGLFGPELLNGPGKMLVRRLDNLIDVTDPVTLTELNLSSESTMFGLVGCITAVESLFVGFMAM